MSRRDRDSIAASRAARRQPDPSFARTRAVERRLERLAPDLASRRWRARHGHLDALGELDVGYRLVTASSPARGRP